MAGGDTFHVSSQPETLYSALGVAESATSRQVKNLAKSIRRDHTTADDFLHDVCLAEEVLGDAALRAEYDRLLGRLREAGLPLPRIGVAIEGARLEPALASRVGAVGLAGARVGAKILKALFALALIIGVLVLIGIGMGEKSSRYGTRFDYKPIKLPDYSKIYIPPPTIDYSRLLAPPPPIVIPKIDIPEFKVPQYKPRTYRTPKTTHPSTATPRVRSKSPPVSPAPSAVEETP